MDTLLSAAGQRLIDVGLSGVVILGLCWALVQLWQAREKERLSYAAKVDEVQEKRITEQRVALEAVGKAIASTEANREALVNALTRSHP